MRQMRRLLVFAVVPLLLPIAAPLAAQEDGSFAGDFQIGFRSVDVSGHDAKFKEDINLDDGPRLFRLSFEYVPADAMRKAVDLIELDINNAGGDPFETMGLRLKKFGDWSLQWNRTKSDYFYEDIILPIDLAGDPALARAGDFHHFDFERVRDTASFDAKLTDRASFTFGLERFTKRGESTTTLDVSRDEFELDRPIDESMNQYQAAFQYTWDKVTVVLEERIRDYENVVELFLPGASAGENPNNLTTLDFFFLDQPYDYTSNDHIVRVTAQPNDKLLLRGMVDFQSLDLDIEAAERSAGTSFAGAPFTTDAVGAGEIERDLELFDFDLTYRLNERVALVGGVKRYTLDQEGDFTFGGDLNRGMWEIETTGIELGVEYAVNPQVLLSGGVLQETREVDSRWEVPGESVLAKEETDQTGFWARASWRPSRTCRLDLSIEDSSFDDPFTLASPTDRQRIRLSGRHAFDNGFTLSGSYAMTDIENSNSGWDSTFDQADLRLAYQRSDLNVSVGYNMVDLDRSIDQIVSTPPGFGSVPPFLVAIAYTAEADFLDGRLRYDPSERWTVGVDLRKYENDGSFGLERDDYRAFVELDVFTDYLVHLGYRTVDYDEAAFDFDDYDADILEVSFGYRW